MTDDERKAHEKAVNAAPQAHSIQSFLCDGCNHVHIIMLDESGGIIAHGTVSDTILDRIVDLHIYSTDRILPPRPVSDAPQG